MATAMHETIAVHGRSDPMSEISSQPTSRSPQLSSIANAGLRASLPLKSVRMSGLARMEPQPLTGAAAMTDEYRFREEVERRVSNMTSANPAVSVKNALMGTSGQGISRPGQAPSAQLSMSPASNSFCPTGHVEEPMQIDSPTASSVNLAIPEPLSVHNGSVSQLQDQTYLVEHEGRSNKAFTYPPPPAINHPLVPVRSGSLPHSNSRLSSTKKHKCPHCSTDFTRHHNLKSHLLTHSQEKPFSCQTCHSKFRRLHDLKRHTKLHTGERPHTCPKCGRAFARGDALARHNKGPAGCAGRRSSAAGDADVDDTVDGVAYSEGDPGDEDQEETESDESNVKRRKSDTKRRQSASSAHSHYQANPTAHNRSQQSSTPSSLTPLSGSTSRFQPSTSAAAHSPRTISSHLTANPQVSENTQFSTVHFNGQPSPLPHGGITESPKPLTPGQESHDQRGRSPSLATQFQNQHFGHGSSRGTSSMSLTLPAGPQTAAGPQLPPLSGLTPDFRYSTVSAVGRQPNVSGIRHPSSILSSQQSSQHGSPSELSSASSLQQSSAGTMREILAPGALPSQVGPGIMSASPSLTVTDANLWDHLRRLESDARNREAHYQAQISRLQDEIAMLRGQQAIPQQQEQPGQAPHPAHSMR